MHTDSDTLLCWWGWMTAHSQDEIRNQLERGKLRLQDRKRKRRKRRKEVKDDNARGKQSPLRNNGSGEERAADPTCPVCGKGHLTIPLPSLLVNNVEISLGHGEHGEHGGHGQQREDSERRELIINAHTLTRKGRQEDRKQDSSISVSTGSKVKCK